MTIDPGIASIVVSMLTAIGVVVASFLANRKANKAMTQATETHLLVNSRMSELLEMAKRASHAAGVEEERVRERSGPRQVEVVNEDPVLVTVTEQPRNPPQS